MWKMKAWNVMCCGQEPQLKWSVMNLSKSRQITNMYAVKTCGVVSNDVVFHIIAPIAVSPLEGHVYVGLNI